jgi:beta-lactamase class A
VELLVADTNTGSFHSLTSTAFSENTIALNGSGRWVNDRQITTPGFNFSLQGNSSINVSPVFAQYYSEYQCSNTLGPAITVAFPIHQGWLQFFADGALLLPNPQQQPAITKNDPFEDLIKTGVRDGATGVLRLPLLQGLLTAGSRLPIAGPGSSISYLDLRKMTNPALMIPTPKDHPVSHATIFIKTGTRKGADVGHLVPEAFWNYLNRPDISPEGWKVDFGLPLTEAIPFTLAQNGSIHQMQVQLFSRDGLLLDQTAQAASGQPTITRLSTGLDYLRTFGPPTVAASPQQPVWTEVSTALMKTPAANSAIAHVDQNFPLTLLGDTSWISEMLWYHVAWTTPKQTAQGWIAGSSLTFTSPGNAPGWANVDTLSPDLAAYLENLGNDVDTVVFDVTRQRYYTYNANTQMITGSSMKVAIMLTFLNMTEQQGRQPTDDEMNLLTTMIENSNNDSASALYYGEIGGAAGVSSYLRQIGISGLNPNPGAWGFSLITPLAMVNILTKLYEGTILTDQDRKLALSLMEQIEPDQRFGVGDTAPDGATVAMKNGWLPGPDGYWATNSSGIVTIGKETYIISVYTQELNSFGAGQDILRHVCGTVASLLT